jgi:ATP-dependent Clp protease ATP-binding subunit ClpB
VKRAVQRELETGLAKALLRGDFGEEDTVVVEAPGGATATHLEFRAKPRAGETKPALPVELIA